MSRPRPRVLVEQTDKHTYKTSQVLASEGIWAVFYEDAPINLKSSHMLTQYPGPQIQKGQLQQSRARHQSRTQAEHAIPHRWFHCGAVAARTANLSHQWIDSYSLKN